MIPLMTMNDHSTQDDIPHTHDDLDGIPLWSWVSKTDAPMPSPAGSPTILKEGR